MPPGWGVAYCTSIRGICVSFGFMHGICSSCRQAAFSEYFLSQLFLSPLSFSRLKTR